MLTVSWFIPSLVNDDRRGIIYIGRHLYRVMVTHVRRSKRERCISLLGINALEKGGDEFRRQGLMLSEKEENELHR